jgi:YD repeat-containing protein
MTAGMPGRDTVAPRRDDSVATRGLDVRRRLDARQRTCALQAAVAFLAVAACSPAPVQRLPGGSLTPKAQTRMAASACGYDVALDTGTPPVVRFRYARDVFGRVAHATGSYTTGPDESIDYAYDHLDHMTHMLDTRTFGSVHVEITERYDTLGDLLEYAQLGGDGAANYTYSMFSDTGQPTREVISAGRDQLGYQITYDAADRVVLVTADDGTITRYTYDDDGRTMTMDTGNGAFHGVVIYDDRDHELSESWDGTDPGALASENLYDWDGDRLLSITYRSGSQAAPHQLATVQVDTLRYDCTTR